MVIGWRYGDDVCLPAFAKIPDVLDGIPHIILFAPDGTILKRNLRGQAMMDEVDKVMKK